MPNWVTNYLTIEGNPESVTKLMEQVGKPYTRPVSDNGDLAYTVKDTLIESPFSFWNVISPTDMDAYLAQPLFNKEDPLWTGNDWYNWNSRNWGTKWDASDVSVGDIVTNGDNLVLLYQYDTPWGVASAVLEKLSAQYPELLFTLEYEEEQGWGGSNEYLRGVETELISYNDKCWECDALDKMDYCEDCDMTVCLACKKTREDTECSHDIISN